VALYNESKHKILPSVGKANKNQKTEKEKCTFLYSREGSVHRPFQIFDPYIQLTGLTNLISGRVSTSVGRFSRAA
jgi:hypothetical protein